MSEEAETVFIIKNALSESATFFLRVPRWAGVESVQTGENLVGNRRFDARVSGQHVTLADSADATLHMYLHPLEQVTLRVPKGGELPRAELWASPASAGVTASRNPENHTAIEFAVTVSAPAPGSVGSRLSRSGAGSGRSRVEASVTCATGVSCGARVLYTPNGNPPTGDFQIEAVPRDPVGRYAVTVAERNGLRVAIADRYAETDPVRAALAACEAPELVSTACGIHRCRVYHAKRIADQGYCVWLRNDSSDSACWRLDDYMCQDESCGYGGTGQPPQLSNDGLGSLVSLESGPGVDGCEVPEPEYRPAGLEPLWPAVVYSAGLQTSLAQPLSGWFPGPGTVPTSATSEVWWGSDPGAMINLVGASSEPIVRSGPRGGVLSLELENLEWLSGRTDPAGTAGERVFHEVPFRELNNRSRGSAGSVAVVASAPAAARVTIGVVLIVGAAVALSFAAASAVRDRRRASARR